ncbi:MAG TPA: chemotaxis response regulator protein-glutamate methylesterase [Candidatus Angelobacter sp.]
MNGVGKIRVLVVDDSTFMRKVLHGIITSDPQLDVCGEAKDGREAVEQCELLKPDVVSMDINMPRMDGLEATELIMTKNPRPILIVSSESRDGAEITLKSLQLGAIDFVAKPSGGIDLDMSSVRDELCRKLKMAAKVRVVRTATRARAPQENGGALQADRTPLLLPQLKGAGKFPLVVLASSTGGPAALMKLVPQFPHDFPGAVLLVQHMPGNYTSQFSKQLAEVAYIRVKEAEAGEIIVPGQLYVCPGACHMRVSSTGRVVLDDGPRINGYRPCADLTFESAADYAGANAIGVVLTGMGNDGTKGAQAVQSAGGHVIAQDEGTAVIFGMPQEAIKSGAVDAVLPLENIYASIERRVLRIFSEAGVGAP